MKKILILFAVLFTVNLAIAQETTKDIYKDNGNLIEATLYHDNGVIAQTGFYTKNNKLQGEWSSYDTAGVKTAEANYENGKKVGTWKFFQGNIVKEVIYADARIAKVNTYEVLNTRVVSNK